ncbi:MAG TPA: PAS domain S-box protein [Bryobacteraceae bacterium]|nr:PAS domain S-box protein [Bryobacteraceae bacterium]
MNRTETEKQLSVEEYPLGCYTGTYDSIPVPLLVCDRSGVIQQYNRRAAELFGHEPKCGIDTLDARLYFQDGLPVLDSAGLPDEIELSLERSDGSRVPVIARASGLRDAQGEISGAILSLIDIGERKRTEAALQEDLSDTKLLQDISTQLIQQEDAQSLYEKILDAAAAIMRSEYASMQMLYPGRGEAGELLLLAQRGFSPESAKFWKWVRADSESTCGVALRTGKRIIVPDVERCGFMAGTEDLESYLHSGIHAVQSTPLFSREGTLLGMISTHWRRPHDPQSRELRLLDILARQAADLIEHRLAADALRQRTAQYTTLLGKAPLGVYLVNADLQIREANSAALPAFGDIPDPIGQPLEQVLRRVWPDEYAEEIVARFRRTLETGQPHLVSEHIEKRRDSGATECYEWQIHRIPLPDGRFGVVCYFRNISAQVQARKAIAESERRFHDLADNISQFAWMADPKGWIFWYNRRWFEYTGTTLAEMEGWGWTKVHHPRHVQRVAAHIQHCWDTGESWEDTFPLRGKDGKYRWFLSRAVPIRDAQGQIVRWFGTNTDITEQRKAEAAARISAKRFRFLAESMPQKVFTTKADGECDYVNQQWLDYTGLPRERFLDRGWIGTLHPDDMNESARLWEHSIKTGEPYRCVNRYRRADGEYRWHLNTARAMRRGSSKAEGGKISMWIGSSTDIHEQKQIEEELRRANEDLNQFAFAASHDLQEPLRMISTYSQLLVRSYSGQLDSHASTYVNFIAQGNKRIRDLLSDLLAYTGLGANREDSHEPVDLNLLLHRVLDNLKTPIEQSGAVVASGELPIVRGQEARFLQLLHNLVSNAIKYRGKEPLGIRISAEKLACEWRFAVADNGRGIAPEYHRKIFGVFKRLHGKDIPGTGIGLAICQRVVESYGGRIWVESQLDCGATFYFTLPAGAPESAA